MNDRPPGIPDDADAWSAIPANLSDAQVEECARAAGIEPGPDGIARGVTREQYELFGCLLAQASLTDAVGGS